ncbi:MAG: Uma2 family endonuclease [Defluviitaleaceae bacterium]|nr:Uma2 family endonuclease [Defluviitaleaceae bacterium]
MFSQSFEMANYPRHGKILRRIATVLGIKYSQNILEDKIQHYTENYALAHQGDKRYPNGFPALELYNVNAEYINEDVFDLANYVQPDFMLFYENRLQESTTTFKMAGCPDLVVEVWSKSNTKAEREFLFYLYSTSNITEFWQIEQDRNEVITSIGGKFLPTQNLQTPLKTQAGLEIELTSIANK